MDYQEYIEALKADFKNFLYVIWQHLSLPEPTEAQYQIADFLQNDELRYKIVECFRGVGKSWITVAYVLWRMFRDIEYKVLVVSASEAHAKDFSAFTKKLINEVPILNHLKADPEQRDSVLSFDIGGCRPALAPSVKARGVTGQLTGSRAVEIVADDVEVPNNSATQDKREKLLKIVEEFNAIIVPNDSRITYLGTPQTEESIYNKLRNQGFSVLIIPVMYPNQDQLKNYCGCLAPYLQERLEKNPKLVGEPCDPQRFGSDYIYTQQGKFGKSGFALQYMMDTSLSDAERYPLKLSDLLVMACPVDRAPSSLAWGSSPELQIMDLLNIGFTGDRFYRPMFIDKDWLPYQGSVMTIDPSGRGKDRMTYAVVNQLNGKLFLVAYGSLKGGYAEDNLEHLAKEARRCSVKEIVVESNFGDGMFNQLMKPVLGKIYPCTISEVRHNTQKEKRIIDTLEPLMNQHRLVVDIDVIRKDIKECQEEAVHSLFYQLTRITKERGALKHDDGVDVVAMAVAYWIEAVAKDNDSEAKAARDQAFEDDLERFMDNALGIKGQSPKRDNWTSNY